MPQTASPLDMLASKVASAISRSFASPARFASPAGNRIASLVASVVASAAPELQAAVPLNTVDPERLASSVLKILSDRRSHEALGAQASNDLLASRIANKLASPSFVASPQFLGRFASRLASAVNRRSMPSLDVDLSGS